MQQYPQFEKRFYQAIAATGSANLEYVPESGEKIHLCEIGGNAARDIDVKVEIFWNDILLLSTHGDTTQRSCLELIGDGSKILKILLTNNSDQSETIGGYILGW